MFKPRTQNFNTTIKVIKRTEENKNGALEFSYTDTPQFICHCQWKGKGGDESENSSVITHTDTAEIVMWYRPDIVISDRVLLNCDANQVYEIISPPENIEMRNQYLMFKVQKVGGG